MTSNHNLALGKERSEQRKIRSNGVTWEDRGLIVREIKESQDPVLEIRRYGIFEVGEQFVVVGLESEQYFHTAQSLQGAVTWLVDVVAPRNYR